MDSRGYQRGFQYNLLNYGDPGLAALTQPVLPDMLAASVTMPATEQAPSRAMPPPPSASATTQVQTMVGPNVGMAPPPVTPGNTLVQTVAVAGTSSEGESSFNDSGYFSPQAPAFTVLTNHQRGAGSGQQGTTFSHGPSRGPNSALGSLMGAPRPSWQEDFPNVNDEWDSNFINNFEENLFGFDAADFNNMVDGLLASPGGSPFKSPAPGRSAVNGLGLSPFSNLSTSNIMLAAMRRSPGRAGGSPFRKLFSTPSPIKGLNSHSRPSPSTRQRRLVLHSPGQRIDSLSDDLPSFLDDIKEEVEHDDLGVAPFQRTNSLGFSPTRDLSSSPPYSALYDESSAHSGQPLVGEDSSQPVAYSSMEAHTLQEIENVTPVRQRRREKRDSAYHPYSSPAQHDSCGYKLRKSPARLSQGRISVTRHFQPVSNLSSKDALRFVRARFTEALEKASADAVVKEKRLQSKMKASSRKRQQCPGKSHTLSDSAAESTSQAAQGSSGIHSYTRVHNHPQAGQKRQEILPKPTPDWPRRQPCKIAPKKRKR